VTAPEGARLVLATHNPHKVVELREILADVVRDRGLDVDLDRAVIGAGDVDGLEEPVENGDSFAANALIKAHAVSVATGLPTSANRRATSTSNRAHWRAAGATRATTSQGRSRRVSLSELCRTVASWATRPSDEALDIAARVAR